MAADLPLDPPVARLLDEDPEEILRTLRHRPPSYSARDWLMMAEEASSNARRPRRVLGEGRPIDPATVRAWARVALASYDRLVDEGVPARRAERDAMRLRADLICAHGEIPGDPVYDADLIFDWFLAGRRPVDEVREIAATPDRSRQQTLELLELKGEMATLRQLADCPRFSDLSIRQWLDLEASLPT
jgi:hypothetical protein